MAPVNPKDIAAQTEGRARLDLLEPAADEQIARALEAGADKYGLRNFTISPIEARTYVAAMRRHLTTFLRGEDYAKDTGFHHLAHVGANVHVVLAAIEARTFIDDRSPAPADPEPAFDLLAATEEYRGYTAFLAQALEHKHRVTTDGFGPCYAGAFWKGERIPDEEIDPPVDGDEPVFETCPASHAEIQSFWQDAGRPQDDEKAQKFKIGDRVRVVDVSESVVNVGDIGTVKSIVQREVAVEGLPYNGRTIDQFFWPEDLELVVEKAFKAGDKVRLVKDNYDPSAANGALLVGDFGSVLDDELDEGGRVRVEFPESNWHGADRWWCCDRDELDLVEEKPPVRRRAVLTFGARGSEVLPS